MKLQLRVLSLRPRERRESLRETLGLDDDNDGDNDDDDGDDESGGGDARNPGCRGNVRGQTEPQ